MNMNPLKGIKVLLASKSPRRAQLLEAIGVEFRQMSLDLIEVFPDELEWRLIPKFLAEQKANDHVHLLKSDEVLIAADSLVFKNGQLMGKPKGKDDAKEMLLQLSNDTHEVITGVCMTNGRDKITFSEETKVSMCQITNEEVEYYLSAFRPYDKAGSYGIQEWFGWNKIKSIQGSYSNVMGLPTHRIYNELLRFTKV
jgi:septum formation protein